MSAKTDIGDKMYIQDEKQKIVGNLDVEGKWDTWYEASQMGTIVLIMPRIGSFVTYQGESYVILSITTHQEDSGEIQPFLPKPVITTICTILPITDEGEDAGKPNIKVEADKLDIL